jgi:Antitoxin Xre/MbcA/ParS C-terminal toxin-binding domain
LEKSLVRASETAPIRADDIAPGRRHDPEVRRRLSGPGMRTFFNIAAAWTLSVNEQRGLLGWPAPSTYHKYKAGRIGTLSYDTLVRISLVVGIYKALHILYPEPELADQWVKLRNANSLFGGRTPLETMIGGGIDALYQVRRLLDGRRGGWN